MRTEPSLANFCTNSIKAYGRRFEYDNDYDGTLEQFRGKEIIRLNGENLYDCGTAAESSASATSEKGIHRDALFHVETKDRVAAYSAATVSVLLAESCCLPISNAKRCTVWSRRACSSAVSSNPPPSSRVTHWSTA